MMDGKKQLNAQWIGKKNKEIKEIKDIKANVQGLAPCTFAFILIYLINKISL